MTSASRIVLLTAGVACATLLAACDDEKKPARPQQTISGTQGKIYKDLDSCLAEAADMDAVKTCREAYQQALDKMAEAPQYERQASCEDVYGPGNCVPRGSVVHDGGSSFVPFMWGFMLGNMGGGRTYYQPVFVDRGGATYAGASVVSAPSWTGGRPSAPAAAMSSSVARGGFGSTASARAVSTVGG